MTRPIALERLVLPKLTELIETALGMAASHEAMDFLPAIAETLGQAKAVAEAGVVLRRRC
jgi:hypothetical protein